MKAILPLCLLACFAPCVRADLRFAEPVVELGEVRGGAPLAVVFSMANAGSERIEIIEVKRGCGCLAPRLDKHVLAAGERASLRMDIRTLGQPNGPHAWNATVRYRAGDVVKETPLVLRAVVKNDVTVQPAVLGMLVESELRQEVTLTDVRTPPLAVVRAECSSRAVKVRATTSAGGVTRITLEASAAGLAPGRYEETLNIYTSDPLYSHLQVPITLTRPTQSAVLVAPDKVHLRVEAGQAVPSTLIRLRPRGDQAIVIDKVEAADPAVTCTFAAGPGLGATLRVSIQSARALESEVRVHLRAPAGEVITIPVQVIVPR